MNTIDSRKSTFNTTLDKGNNAEELITNLANNIYKEDLTHELIEEMVMDYTPVEKNNEVEDLQLNKHIKNGINLSSYPIKDIGNSYYFLPNAANYQNVKAQQEIPHYSINNYDINSIRKDFPMLRKRINGRPLVWLDNSATTQKPYHVIDALNRYYVEINSNVHRGAHTLARLATNAYETAREKVQKFIGASSPDEIIFVRGATEAINLVAQTYGAMNIESGDEILITMMEHHSNIVPWQVLKQAKGVIIKPIPINEHGEIILEKYEKLFTPRTKMVALTHVSNVLGTINPVKAMIEIAHQQGVCVLIDGAQSAPHMDIDVSEIDADFYVFSGHKIYGPTGIGVLYGKKAILEEMPPWQRGGGMIKNVTFDKTTYNKLPNKFEAGTGNIAGAVGLGAAIDYIQNIDINNIQQHERQLTAYAMNTLSQIPGVQLIGTALNKTSVISFIVDGISPESVAKYLNQEGIAVRSGHHCAQPAIRRYGLDSTVRASIGMYNTTDEIDCLASAISDISKYYH